MLPGGAAEGEFRGSHGMEMGWRLVHQSRVKVGGETWREGTNSLSFLLLPKMTIFRMQMKKTVS